MLRLFSLLRARSRGGLADWRAGSAVLAAGIGISLACGCTAQAAILNLQCTNPASGTTWAIVIDLERHLVGSIPAEITDARISWHDPSQGYFELDRASGRLEFRNASSTGGYFLHYRCRPE